jgi:glycosyltransferase involved in cell wall biosynthesis
MTEPTSSLVSGIIIFLNGEPFIEEAIASVFAQTHKNWELLLVDDGSTDSSSAIAQQYAQQYPDQVRYLEHDNHQNRGMSASRNLGISHAKGEFIGFLDADDLWLPQKLEQQLDCFSRYPEAAMVYGRTLIWYSWVEQTSNQEQDYFYELGVCPNRVIQPPLLFKQLLNNKYQTPTTCNALMRRKVFDQVGQFEESFRAMYEDQVFFSKVMLKMPIYVADACWAKYRQHPQSCSAKNERQAYYTARQPFLAWIQHYLKNQNIEDIEIIQQVEQEVWQCQHPRAAHLINRVQHYSNQVQSLLKRSLTLT